MKDPIYQFTETEAKAYDAMRSVIETLSKNEQVGCILGYSDCISFGTACDCTNCKMNEAIELLKKVDQENEI